MKLQKQLGLIAAVASTAALWAAIVSPAQAQGAQSAQAKVRVMVSFKPGSGAGARSAIASAGGRVVLDLSEANGLAAELPASALAALRRNPNIEFVEDDPPMRTFRSAAPQAHLPAAYPASMAQVVPYGIPMVQADQVSDNLAGIRKLCIIDSGIDRNHVDLAGLTLDGVNLTKSGQWHTDENSHGTHVAGTIAAVDNAIGVIGVMPHRTISLFIAKVFDAAGSAPTSVIARAMLDCMTARADVVNMSLGGDVPSMLGFRVSELLAKRNILLVAAAGNSGNTEVLVSYPAGYPGVVSVAAIDSSGQVASFSQRNSDVELAAPGVAVLSTVPVGSQVGAELTVGGVDHPALPMQNSPKASATGPLADFGIGDSLGAMSGKVCLIQRGTITFAKKVLNCQNSGGVAAVIYNNGAGDLNGTLGTTVTTIPSVGITKALGESLLATELGKQTTVSVFETADAYAKYSGTSMATPHVAGVAALVWSHFPHCTAAQIRSSLDKSALDLVAAPAALGRDPYTGFGLVQAKAAYDRIGSMGCGN